MPVAALSSGGAPFADETPPPPRRRKGGVGYAIVGFIGEIMITLGVFLGLFVVWQLVWTDVMAGRVQNEAASHLVKTWEPPNPQDSGVRHTDDPPVMKPPKIGQEIGFLHVPRFGMDYKRLITQGVDKPTILDRLGIGHYPDTQMPGEMGNFALAGHRVTFSKPFNQIHELKPGDAIVVETKDVWYVYKMISNKVVFPAEYSVVYPNPGGKPDEKGTRRLLTLTACHPQFSARERYIVHAELEYWELKTEGTPPELKEKPKK